MVDQKPIKILQVIHSLSMGGAETWLMEVLRLWSKSGIGEMHFLCTSGTEGIFDDEARNLGAHIHYVIYSRSHLPRFTKAFRRILRNEQFAAIHDHADYTSGWHFLMGIGVLPPVRIAHVHNPWIHISENYAVSPARQIAVKVGKWLVHLLATHVTGTSEEILRRYGFSPQTSGDVSISTLHCGFNVSKFNTSEISERKVVLNEFGWPETSRVVLFAGRLDRALEFDHPQNHKNSWFALNVVRAASEKDPAIRLLMVGAGNDSLAELERQIDLWGLRGKLRLIGLRNDLPRLMRTSDVLLFPSRQEGLGMVAVEAQAAGLPVLASTAVPSECVVLPELYDALPLDRSIDQWADALLQRIAKPRPSQEACRQAVEASAFSIENSVRRLQEIYSGKRA